MRPRARRARAVLRDRQREARQGEGFPIFAPMSGYDLFLVNRYRSYVNWAEGKLR